MSVKRYGSTDIKIPFHQRDTYQKFPGYISYSNSVTKIKLSKIKPTKIKPASSRPYLAVKDDNITSSQEKHEWIYIHFCKPYNNSTLQDSELTCNNFSWQVSMVWPLRDHTKKSYGFMSTFTSPMANQITRMIYQYAQVLLTTVTGS